MIDLAKHKMSASELVKEFVDCYATKDEKSGFISMDVDDVPFDQLERYAKAKILEDNNNQWATESDELYDSILCVVGNELDLDQQDDIIHSIKSQAVDYYHDELKSDIATELRERIPENLKPNIDNEHMIDYNKDRMLLSEMAGH